MSILRICLLLVLLGLPASAQIADRPLSGAGIDGMGSLSASTGLGPQQTGCVLVAGTTTNCLLVAGTTTNSVLIR